MAKTRFGDDFNAENYQETENLTPNIEGAAIADELNKLLGEKICCVPVVHAETANPASVGLGDAFVGGFLPALLS